MSVFFPFSQVVFFCCVRCANELWGSLTVAVVRPPTSTAVQHLRRHCFFRANSVGAARAARGVKKKKSQPRFYLTLWRGAPAELINRFWQRGRRTTRPSNHFSPRRQYFIAPGDARRRRQQPGKKIARAHHFRI